MSKTNYLENALLDHVLRGVQYPCPAGIYVALFTAAPGETAGGTEITGGSYARQGAVFTAAANGQVTNSSDVTFPQATANWGTITHFALLDAISGGNMLYYGALTTSKTINTGDQLKFATGGIAVTED